MPLLVNELFSFTLEKVSGGHCFQPTHCLQLATDPDTHCRVLAHFPIP